LKHIASPLAYSSHGGIVARSDATKRKILGKFKVGQMDSLPVTREK
jgi:hypothetical protein